MQELNIYGDVSGGWIFSEMDKLAHKKAISYIGDCVTANANINYISPLCREDKYLFFTYIQFQTENKSGISVRLEKYNGTLVAYGNFLFIKRK